MVTQSIITINLVVKYSSAHNVTNSLSFEVYVLESARVSFNTMQDFPGLKMLDFVKVGFYKSRKINH